MLRLTACFSVGIILITGSVCSSQVLDFPKYEFSNKGTTTLNGDWNFYWNKLLLPSEVYQHKPDIIQMPHAWLEDSRFPMFGVGTYHVKLLLPEKNTPLVSIFPSLGVRVKFF